MQLRLYSILLVGALAWSSPAPAQEDDIPQPLSLPQALAFAAGHPRTRLDAAQAAILPRRPPLYLSCHELAFGAAATGDDARSQPLYTLLDPLDAQRLEILMRFLDVTLADLSYSRYNEAMAVAYVQLDRAENRRELGQFSDLRVADLTATYQEVRRNRTGAEAAQRLTRALLAQALNRPETLPRDLVPPNPPPVPDPLPDLKTLVATALRDNRALAERKAQDPALAPIVDLELRQQALELLLRMEALAAASQSAAAESALRDLNLDQSRVLYEQEAAADLGYSMSQQTKARLDEQRVADCQALTWAELQALQGHPVWPETTTPAAKTEKSP